MPSWDCCRTCLSIQSLNAIFPNTEHADIYSNVLFIATGLKVEMNDSLPQEICSDCIHYINNYMKFRKKCQATLEHLEDVATSKKFYHIKIESNVKSEVTDVPNKSSLDITDFLPNNFSDCDDMTLDSLKNIDLDTKTTDNLNNVDVKTDTRIIEDNLVNLNSKVKSVKKRGRKKKEVEEDKKENGKIEKDKVKERIECEHCHKILSSRTSLRNHYKIHTGFDIVCEHCGKKFITRRLLLMHCKAKHGYEKTDKCSYCDYKASNAEQVKIHERLHTGEKPFVCSECRASFHRRSNYLQHIAIHLPEKTVKCPQCPALFQSGTLMRIHRRRHVSARRYSCGVCGGVFARRRNAARHLARVHALTDCRAHLALHTG